jgi:MFS family permease
VVVGAALSALMIAPALMALTIKESERVEHTVGELFGHMIRDVWRVAKSRPGWTGILFCISPVGSAALINYFAGLAPDYHASAKMVGFINGPVNGLVSAAGALVAGFACDRMNRRAAYLISGGLTAVCGVVMALSPLSPNTYAVGVTFYLLISGFCYAAFSAVVLEAIGKAGPAASTQYTLFTSAGNFAIMYVGWLDTRFHHSHGVRGLLSVDAGANVIGIILLSIMIALVYRKKAEPIAESAAA